MTAYYRQGDVLRFDHDVGDRVLVTLTFTTDATTGIAVADIGPLEFFLERVSMTKWAVGQESTAFVRLYDEHRHDVLLGRLNSVDTNTAIEQAIAREINGHSFALALSGHHRLRVTTPDGPNSGVLRLHGRRTAGWYDRT